MKMSSSISSVTISHHATAKFNETHQNSLLARLVCMYVFFFCKRKLHVFALK